MSLTVKVIERYEDLPEFPEGSFFHSRELFRVTAATPGHHPLMAVAFREDGSVAAHLLACIRRRGSWLPPYLFTQGRIFGEGDYDTDVDRDETFRLLLQSVTQRFQRPLCLYAEFSNISQKMFGYKAFRELGYFPVSWQEVHNSIHSIHLEERLDKKIQAQIGKCQQAGVTTRRLTSNDEVATFYRLLRSYYHAKARMFIPHERYFSELKSSSHAHFFLTEYKGKAIGCCLTIYSGENAYLWYLAAKRKSHAAQHPATLTVWHAMKQAADDRCRHFYFMNAGLPFRKSSYRDFILSFGGKPVAKYRWFRFSFRWVNSFFSWLYRE